MNQNDLVLKALRAGKKLTPALAKSQYRVVNLRARISDLRNHMGITEIVTGVNKSGNTAYYLAK